MFFKKRSPSSVILEQKQRDIGWDDGTLEHIAKSDCFNVQITNVVKRSRFGARENEPPHDANGYEISGVITFPKLLLVSISFETVSETFGGWFYNLYNHESNFQKINIPFFELYLSDRDGKMASAIFEAHRAALLSGRRYSFARFWKRKGDGIMTAKDREHGYSYESRYPLIGLLTWAELESVKLPEWAVPYDSDRFSIENLPKRFDLRL